MLTSDSVFANAAVAFYYFLIQPWISLATFLKAMALTAVFATTTVLSGHDAHDPVPMRSGLVEQIERRTRRTVGIETTIDADTLAKCHPQSKSALFMLPKELRDLIFESACSQSPDNSEKYSENAHHYRPGHTAKLKTYTSLLLTCRRAWLDANAMPMQQAEHAFWFQRGPYDQHVDTGWASNVRKERDRYTRLVQSLTPSNLRSFTRIHLFMQMFQAEQMTQYTRLAGFFPPSLRQPGAKPRRFQITIRFSDWWDWERAEPLRLRTEWVQGLLDSQLLSGVDEFSLELETVNKHFGQLDAIIEQVRKLEGKPVRCSNGDDHEPKTRKFTYQEPAETAFWNRSSRIGNKNHIIFAGIPILHLRATTLTWKRRNCEPATPIGQSAATTKLQRPGTSPAPTTALRVHAQVQPRSSAMIDRSRLLRRDQMRQHGWSDGMFPDKADIMWTKSVKQAEIVHDVVRESFEGMMGDLESRRYEALWEQQGSLLRLE